MTPTSERVPLYFWVSLAALAVASGVWFFWPASKAPHVEAARKQVPKQVIPVETIHPSRQTLERVSESSPAEVLPFEETDIYAKVSGYLEKIHVDIGDVVHPPSNGDKDLTQMVKEKKVLAELWVPEMVANVEQKKAHVELAAKAFEVADKQVATAFSQIEEAQAGLNRAIANRKRWDFEYSRIEKLVKQRVIDEQTSLETWNQLQAAKAGEEEAAAKVKSAKALHEESKAKRDKAQADQDVAKANLTYAETLLKYARVEAPFEGVVSKLNLHTGAFLNPSTNKNQPICTITRTDKLRIVVDIPEKDVRYLNLNKEKPNNLVRVKFDALPDLPAKNQPFRWRVTRFAPVLGAGKKVRAEIHVQNPGGKLMPNMYGHAAVVLEVKPRALTIPAGCLSPNGKDYFVYKVVDNKAHKQAVKIGLNDGKRVEITGGLTKDDEVVFKGKDSLRDGQPVRVPRPAAGNVGKD